MKLLRELTELQQQRGFLDEECLRELAKRANVPLHRLQGLVTFYPHFRTTPPPRVTVDVCRDLSCAMRRKDGCIDKLLQQVSERDDVEVHEVSCLGRCDHAPAAAINGHPIAPHDLTEESFVLDCLAQADGSWSEAHKTQPGTWTCDPYPAASEHYGTVRRFVEEKADLGSVCIERLQQSGLKGMGGAGFPTGTKWKLVAGESEPTKYVICNADESEPGTFKDRMILQQLPHLVLEGMLLAALTIGAEQGIVFLRHEYGPEGEVLQAAIDDAYARGILGKNAAGSGRTFDVEIFTSPGGYILGEETALLEALEDHRGEPRNRPPYPGTHGLWGKPTLVNNVETLALATSIIHHGCEWWQDQGAGDYAGLKFFSISGDVEQPGVHEVPHGITIADLIERAGGMKEGMQLKAVLPGGASSNFLTADQIATPLDFEALREAGSMLGSGAVVVIGEGRNLYELGLNITQFFRNESCGKCVPCRLGTEKAVQMLQQVSAGELSRDELDLLPDLNETLRQTSICGLGQIALGPINSALERFPEDVPGDE